MTADDLPDDMCELALVSAAMAADSCSDAADASPKRECCCAFASRSSFR